MKSAITEKCKKEGAIANRLHGAIAKDAQKRWYLSLVLEDKKAFFAGEGYEHSRRKSIAKAGNVKTPSS